MGYIFVINCKPTSFVCVFILARFKHRSKKIPTENSKSSLLWIPITMADRSKARVCGHSLAGIAGSNPTGVWMSVSCECCVFWGRGICDGPISRPEESTECVSLIVCDHIHK